MLTTKELKEKFFKSDHPNKIYEDKVWSVLEKPFTLLDAGCGRTAPVLSKFIGHARKLIGIDLEEPTGDLSEIKYIKGDISNIDVPSDSVDLVISKAVLEHVTDPDSAFKEINRILKPKGNFVFMIPNLYDYVSIISKIIPNRFHKVIVAKAEGRAMDDTFPAYYKVNTYRAIKKQCDTHNFVVVSFEWLGQYPSCLMFNPYLFLIGTVYEKIISRFNSLRFLRGWLLVHLKKI